MKFFLLFFSLCSLLVARIFFLSINMAIIRQKNKNKKTLNYDLVAGAIHRSLYTSLVGYLAALLLHPHSKNVSVKRAS